MAHAPVQAGVGCAGEFRQKDGVHVMGHYSDGGFTECAGLESHDIRRDSQRRRAQEACHSRPRRGHRCGSQHPGPVHGGARDMSQNHGEHPAFRRLTEEGVAAGLPVGDEAGFELACLAVVVGVDGGEAQGVSEHAQVSSEFGVGLAGEVLEESAADAGGGYSDVEAFGGVSGWEPEGIDSALVAGQFHDLVALEWSGVCFESVFE